MATTRILLGIICYAFTGSLGMFKGHVLGAREHQLSGARQQLLAIAGKEIGVREKTGHNDGARVVEYLTSVKLKQGDPWCAAYVSWVYAKAGFSGPRSGWSPALFPASRLTKIILPADILGVYFESYKRIAHVGLVERLDGDYCVSLEGNTNPGGSRDGEGVYRRRRLLKTLHHFADWVRPERRLP